MSAPDAIVLTGTKLPWLATDVVTRVAVPFLAAMWLGKRWPWAVMIILVYHFMIALPIRMTVPSSGGTAKQFSAALFHPANNGTTTTGQPTMAFVQYFVGIPLMAIIAAISGALCFYLYSLPKHLVPLGHTFTCLRSVIHDTDGQTFDAADQQAYEEHNVTPLAYKVWATACFLFMSPLSFMLCYECITWLLPGHGRSLGALLTIVVPPTWSMLACLIGFFAFGRLSNLFGKKMRSNTRHRLNTLLKIVWLHIIVVIPPVVVVYLTGNYHATWVTAMGSLTVALAAGATMRFACYGKETPVEYKDSMKLLQT